ncbi:MAG: carboxypeptidase M32 [Candidatus Dormibacterales bacterium]
MDQMLDELRTIHAEVSDLQGAASALYWDKETYLPPGGLESRVDQLGTLERLAHERLTAPRVGELLDGLEARPGGWEAGAPEEALVRVTRRDFDLERRIPASLVEEIARAGAEARPVWVEARRRSDFSMFAPHLARNVDISRRIAEAIGYQRRPYDALLERTEPGITTTAVEAIFAEIKEAVLPMLRQIAARPRAVDDSFLRREFDQHAQIVFSLRAAAELGYDLERGRLDLSAHPFTITIGPGDVRITSRVRKDYWPDCFFSTLHEAGHGMFGQGIDPALGRTLLFHASSPGVNESQSRLWENLIARSRAYWRFKFTHLRAAFPAQLAGVGTEAFYRAVNRVEPTYIRTDADELTYNLHVMIRFDLENDLLEGRLQAADAREAWNAKVEEYLGLPPPPDADGILQDVHWSHGDALGSFTSYTIGNVIGAQLMKTLQEEVPDLQDRVAGGDLTMVQAWMAENVHRPGRTVTPTELVERTTGAPIGARAWIDYVRRKFGEIYEMNLD